MDNEMEKYAHRQNDLGQELKKLLENMKKDSAARKTEQYVTNKRNKTKEIWDEIKTNHKVMCDLKDPDHKYFTEEYGSKLEKQVREIEKYLNECPKASTSKFPEEEEKNKKPLNVRKLEVHIKKLMKTIEETREELGQNQSKTRYEMQKKRILQGADEIWNLRYEIEYDDEEKSYVNELTFEECERNVKEVIDDLEKVMSSPKSNNDSTIQLPRIKLPTFDSSYENWPTFHDLFFKIVHQNTSLTNAEKMQYLKTHVDGDALRVIQHLQISEVNYATAWELLKKRYENNRLIVSKLIDKILDIQPFRTESMQGIKNLHDTTCECLQAINNANVSTETWGPLIIRILTRKWDSETNKLYEQSLINPNEVQSFEDLLQFLRKRFQSLEAIGEENKNNTMQSYTKNNKSRTTTCKHCNENHTIHNCKDFKDLSTEKRTQFVRENKLCYRCLNHSTEVKCLSNRNCYTCGKPHHTLLHREFSNSDGTKNNSSSQDPRVKKEIKNQSAKPFNNNGKQATTSNHVGVQEGTVLLATALIRAETSLGTTEYIRVLIDSGSQACFISEQAAQLLGLPKERIHAEISGMGSGEPKISKAKVEMKIQPRFPSNFHLTTNFLILPKVTQSLPNHNIQIDSNQFINKILADPTFNSPGPIDAIIGAEEYGKIILEGLQKTEDGLLGQNTEFGWILSGTVKREINSQIYVTSLVSRVEEDKQLTKFWEMEEVPEERFLNQEDMSCEEHYQRHVRRNEDGRYIVKMPFKCEPNLGESRNRAVARLLQLEKKLEKDENLRQQYCEFMAEYLKLGHMEPVLQHEKEGRYYIPHQAVIRPSSTTTKLRVVFDASCKTSNGTSLNETMHTGPRLQQDLADILLRWRKHRIVFSADIEKMYRQIDIDREDQEYQRILWRFDKSKPIQEFRLKTVTYGTACAPYLAVKTLQRLAIDEKEKYPIASKVLLKDFYVDDVLSGADCEEDACILQQQLKQMFRAGGFTLRKWSSNSKKVLKSLSEEEHGQMALEIMEDGVKKSLGVHWAPYTDEFKFKVKISTDKIITKRTILSEVAKLFDPLGWLAPVVITAKLLIQELWLQELEWDEAPSSEIQRRWKEFQGKLKSLEEVCVPRWVNTSKICKLQLHGFCDASEKAYGAVVYTKTTMPDGTSKINLLVAKSKVAPARSKTTLPKLELCSGLLLAKLLKRTKKTLEWEDVPTYAWTDSMIALAWIKGDASRWKTFVANRVTEINKLIPKQNWFHVSTQHNPADVISRGIDPSKIKTHSIWWNGPPWLTNPDGWPVQAEIGDIKEERKTCLKAVIKTRHDMVVNRFSSLQRMVRVLSYCRRFVTNTRKGGKKTDFLTVAEMEETLQQIIKTVQKDEYKEEIHSKGILRVGGRLQNSKLPFDAQHPMILPNHHHLTTLIIESCHQRVLHGGTQLTLGLIRNKYWIINGKRTVQAALKKCVKCLRFRAETAQQLMGDLPAERVTASPPFSHTGVDYAGPIQLRTTKGRGHKSYKGYIAVFVCLATKAIHLEVVSDMTTEAFLAAFRRFTSRRGPCPHMFSDNGTTFVGASKLLEKEVHKITKSADVQNQVSNQGTQWHFIPPAAPHFGGLWEAGVKSMKHHFKRVIGETTFTYEEMTTLLHQIEACLNSRPLTALTNETSDVILTPGHFLIGRPIVAPPDPISLEVETNISSRWRQLQKIKRDFWHKWSTDYLTNLQQRYKWKTREKDMEVGDIVIIKENNITPTKWPLAKIIETHPANDRTVRVVSIQKAGGAITKRPIHNLIPLPMSKIEATEKKKNQSTTWPAF